jgi:hypothetical protein
MKFWGPMTLMLALNVGACAKEKNDSDATASDEGLAPLLENQESSRIELDATSRTEWVGFDLDEGTFISAADFPAAKGWDLAFKRTSIKMEAGVAMQIVDAGYAALTVAPADGYRSDQPASAPSAPETDGLAFHADPAWFAYDITTHTVSSQGLTYVVRSQEGRYFKLKIHDYYNAARLPAYINLEFQEVKGVTP